MGETDALLDRFKESEHVEVDHATVLYLEPGMRMPLRDVKAIRDHGYKIQDITNQGNQTKITIVKDE